MLSFKQFITERSINPVDLADRTAKIYAKKTHRTEYSKSPKGTYIPFTKVAHPSRTASAVQKHERLGGKVEPKRTTFAISDLHATQHHADVGDKEKLRSKVAEKDPKHIHVITHKGKHLVADGHHAVMAARLRGEKHVTVHHTNLDEV